MTPEEKARLKIDELLTAAGWQIQDYKQMNLGASHGVALREFQLKQDAADYLLFVAGEPVGVIEAKPEGYTLSGVSEQSRKYLEAMPQVFTAATEPPPFAYESTGVERFFCDFRDPDARSRRVFAFHKPETLGKWREQEKTLRARLRQAPPLITDGLRDCQVEAITELEKSFAAALAKEACKPLDDPKLRETLVAIKTRNEQVIDTVSKDTVLFAGFDEAAKEKARGVIESFKQFIEANRNELTALQIIYNQPHGRRHLTYDAIRQLANAIEKPPYNLRAESVWQAYAQLEKSRVRGTPQRVLADLISLISFAIGESAELAPFAETVNERFQAWLAAQQKAGRIFSVEQRQWLEMIRDHIATSLRIEMDDFDDVPFHERGGRMRVYKLFGDEAPNILNDLNDALAA